MATSKLAAMLGKKCPHCRQGDMFKHGDLEVTKFNQMHTHCPHCGQNLIPELGFYYGAMYISYGFNVALMFAIIIGMNLFYDPPLVELIGTVIAAMLLMLPFFFRTARSFMLHLFGGIEYDPSLDHKGKTA